MRQRSGVADQPAFGLGIERRAAVARHIDLQDLVRAGQAVAGHADDFWNLGAMPGQLHNAAVADRAQDQVSSAGRQDETGSNISEDMGQALDVGERLDAVVPLRPRQLKRARQQDIVRRLANAITEAGALVLLGSSPRPPISET